MGKAVIGFKDLTTTFHAEMSRFILRPSKRKLALAPRGHLKSSLWTIADTLRIIAKNPNERVLLINENIENASHFLRRIRATVERNEVFRWLFPEVLPRKDATWHQTALEFRRTEDFPEASIEVIGVGGASTSRHYTIIKEDDLVGKEASRSQAKMEEAIEQHKLAESLLNAPDDQIQTYGTRWGPYDLTRWMLENEPNLDWFKLGIYKPNGEPIWPDRFTGEHIEFLRRKYGPAMFALQYLNEAIAEGVTEFDPGKLRYWHESENEKGEPVIVLERPRSEGGPYVVTMREMERYEIVDPCHSPESGDARTAVVVLGLTGASPFDVVLLEARAKKLSGSQTVEEAWEVYQKWDPVSCGIEVVAGQRAFFNLIPRLKPTMGIRPLKTPPNKSKLGRIRGFYPYAEHGRFYVHRDMMDFHEEWEAFPEGRTMDLLDAIAYGPDIWAPPEGAGVEEYDEEEEREMEIRSLGRSPVTGY